MKTTLSAEQRREIQTLIDRALASLKDDIRRLRGDEKQKKDRNLSKQLLE